MRALSIWQGESLSEKHQPDPLLLPLVNSKRSWLPRIIRAGQLLFFSLHRISGITRLTVLLLIFYGELVD